MKRTVIIVLFPAFVFAMFFIVGTSNDVCEVPGTTHIYKVQTKRDSIIKFAEQYIGTKYCYGSMNPELGFDCSGFVNFIFNNFGIKLPRSSKDFVSVGVSVDISECKKGDIMIFAGRNIKAQPIGHVGIVYENNNGKVKFIHSASSKKIGVVITDFNSTEYYLSRLVDIKNLLWEY